jgi:hypothetical protein
VDGWGVKTVYHGPVLLSCHPKEDLCWQLALARAPGLAVAALCMCYALGEVA